jgi:8-oxo-dGTP pyrophosphatase MutT (NUDIX family)
MTDALRQAASLIGVRDGEGAPEVLVIERTTDHRFLPGYVAFPGGAVDPPDGDLAARWFGDGVTAARATALRELAEEVGLAVTRDGVVAAPSSHPLEPIHRSPPGSDTLAEIARWIAPERVPVRFDARYYAVRMDAAPAPRPDGSEAGAAWWASPSSLLAAWERGDLLLYWPTHFTVAALAGCRDADEVLALRIGTREPVDRELEELPRSVFFQD